MDYAGVTGINTATSANAWNFEVNTNCFWTLGLVGKVVLILCLEYGFVLFRFHFAIEDFFFGYWSLSMMTRFWASVFLTLSHRATCNKALFSCSPKEEAVECTRCTRWLCVAALECVETRCSFSPGHLICLRELPDNELYTVLFSKPFIHDPCPATMSDNP